MPHPSTKRPANDPPQADKRKIRCHARLPDYVRKINGGGNAGMEDARRLVRGMIGDAEQA